MGEALPPCRHWATPLRYSKGLKGSEKEACTVWRFWIVLNDCVNISREANTKFELQAQELDKLWHGQKKVSACGQRY